MLNAERKLLVYMTEMSLILNAMTKNMYENCCDPRIYIFFDMLYIYG